MLKFNKEIPVQIWFYAFLINGVISILIGISVKATYITYRVFLNDVFFSFIPLYLLLSGCLTIILTFVSCIGVLRLKRSLVLIFTGFMTTILLVQIIVLAYGHLSYGVLTTAVQKDLSESMNRFNREDEMNLRKAWDTLQDTLKCCGAEKSQEWYSALSKNYLPFSCCEIPAGQVDPFICNAGKKDADDDETTLTTSTTVPSSTVETTTNVPTTTKDTGLDYLKIITYSARPGCMDGLTSKLFSLELQFAGLALPFLQLIGLISTYAVLRKMQSDDDDADAEMQRVDPGSDEGIDQESGSKGSDEDEP